MDISSQMSISLQENSAAQGVQGHHHHHKKGITDMINDLESAINDATKSGALTSDQASALTKLLDDVKKTLAQAQSAGSSQAGGAVQLSSDDREKIRKDIRDIGKQLFAALSSQNTSSTKQGNGVDAILKALDTNQDGSISKDELTSFFNSQTSSAWNNTNGFGAGKVLYSEQATFSMYESRSTFSVTA
jgi:hypothetical protein